ncbi:MAG: diacylglycerol kinase family lipid kinase [Legionellaceae bacterium]|nr:diacylglycerol kinase family lipid kinase [Legionellaceae bacterium]
MSGKRIAVVINPMSGGGWGSKAWDVLRPGLQALFEVIDGRLSNRVEDLAKITEILLHTAPDYLLVIGGDGTLSQAINGFFHQDKPRSPNTRLAYFNSGSGGDFARLFPAQRVTEFLDRLIHDEYQWTNIGKICYADEKVHYFINIASCGLSAYVAEQMPDSRWLKKLGGTVNYFMQGVLGLFRYRPIPVCIYLDEQEPFYAKLLLIAICNGQYFGGKMHVAPMAEIDDDVLDVVMCLNFSRFEALRKFHKLYSGRHLREKKVHYRQVKKIRISSPEQAVLPFEADGEMVGTLPADFSLLADKLPLIV